MHPRHSGVRTGRASCLVLIPAALVALAAVAALAACTAAPSGSPAPDGSPGTSPVPGTPGSPGSEAPRPTSPLFGQPPPKDPCELLRPDEIQTVLEGPYLTTEQETSRGAAYSCIFETQDETDRIAVTVRKEPMTVEGFIERMEEFGERATPVADLDVPAGLVVFGPTATVYALHGTVQFYIDVVKDGRSGGDVSPIALGLMERALTRMSPSASPTDEAPTGG